MAVNLQPVLFALGFALELVPQRFDGYRLRVVEAERELRDRPLDHDLPGVVRASLARWDPVAVRGVVRRIERLARME
jgi:hypothetical protein